MIEDLFDGLFISPYERERWLKDQEIFIKRLRELKDKSELYHSIKNLQDMQRAKQCSVLIPEIMQEKLEKTTKK